MSTKRRIPITNKQLKLLIDYMASAIGSPAVTFRNKHKAAMTILKAEQLNIQSGQSKDAPQQITRIEFVEEVLPPVPENSQEDEES